MSRFCFFGLDPKVSFVGLNVVFSEAVPVMAHAPGRKGKNELIGIGFNYDLLETKLGDKVRTAADRIRERIKDCRGQLREFADSLDGLKGSKKTKKE